MNQILKVRFPTLESVLYSSLTSTVPFEKARLQVPLEPIKWPANRERASVNSFGIGGANAHVRLAYASYFTADLFRLSSTLRLRLA